MLRVKSGGDFRAGGVVASTSISRWLGLKVRLTLVTMMNGWPDTVFEESVMFGKLGVCLMMVIPLACHDPLEFELQIPVNHGRKHFFTRRLDGKLSPA